MVGSRQVRSPEVEGAGGEEVTLREGLLWQLRKGLTQEALNEAKAVYYSRFGTEPRAIYCSQASQPIAGVIQDRSIPLGTLLLEFSSGNLTP